MTQCTARLGITDTCQASTGSPRMVAVSSRTRRLSRLCYVFRDPGIGKTSQSLAIGVCMLLDVAKSDVGDGIVKEGIAVF
ncbi:hypothetical protein O9K51_01142 [Purpureocillium lavendulum]|uniref:SNF2 N-terminal domain-containing protein n=1 Tax=Purpureocillium lavendulum TaxID=1247861 RepID=A0AB34G4G7_9HYPO|nr:hypothetical protein O9K51_01142 [Purpureocillium lavendulum]